MENSDTRIVSRLLFLLIASSLLTSEARAASVLSEVLNGYGDYETGEGTNFEQRTVVGEVAQGSSDGSFELEEAGGSGTLDYSVSGSASATYNSLRATSTASVNNTYYDSDYNHTPALGLIPIGYSAQSIARFTDTLEYGGTATNYTSRYIFRLTGSISGNHSDTTARASVTHAGEPTRNWSFSGNGDFDLVLTSEAYVHGTIPQVITIQLLTQVGIFTDLYPDESNISGTASFENTFELIGIDLRDQDGNLMPQGTITRESGEAVDIIGIPEPSSFALVLISFAGLLLRRSR